MTQWIFINHLFASQSSTITSDDITNERKIQKLTWTILILNDSDNSLLEIVFRSRSLFYTLFLSISYSPALFRQNLKNLPVNREYFFYEDDGVKHIQIFNITELKVNRQFLGICSNLKSELFGTLKFRGPINIWASVRKKILRAFTQAYLVRWKWVEWILVKFSPCYTAHVGLMTVWWSSPNDFQESLARERTLIVFVAVEIPRSMLTSHLNARFFHSCCTRYLSRVDCSVIRRQLKLLATKYFSGVNNSQNTALI